MPFKNPHPLYSVWQSMRDRCLNPKSRAWNNYGGRGVKICDRWDDFQTFAADMGPRPDGRSLDRIDNDGDYTPENCRWATRRQQQLNRRIAVYVEVEGVSYRAAELAAKAGVKLSTIKDRAARGLPLSDVLSPDKLHDLSGLALGGAASGKKQKAKTHCPKGHEYTDENTIVSRQGWRRCRVCFYAKERARLAKKAWISSN